MPGQSHGAPRLRETGAARLYNGREPSWDWRRMGGSSINKPSSHQLGSCAMKHPMKPLSIACGLIFAAALPLTAQADVKVETLTHTNEVTGLSNRDSDTTDYFQGNKKREENL